MLRKLKAAWQKRRLSMSQIKAILRSDPKARKSVSTALAQNQMQTALDTLYKAANALRMSLAPEISQKAPPKDDKQRNQKDPPAPSPNTDQQHNKPKNPPEKPNEPTR
eukprot:2198309-Amphidinium_carterae.1